MKYYDKIRIYHAFLNKNLNFKYYVKIMTALDILIAHATFFARYNKKTIIIFYVKETA